jgi:hypothetical protein
MAPQTGIPIRPNFYAAYVRDPDGHRRACACMTNDPKEDRH